MHYNLLYIFQIEKISDKSQGLEKVSSGLFLAWLGFIFQSFVSPFNIALSYLGFLLTGYLYGSFQRVEKVSQRSIPSIKGRAAWIISSAKFAADSALLKVILLPLYIAILILGLQPMNADAKFRDGIEQGNGRILYEIALKQPKSFQTMYYAVDIFRQNERFELAFPIIKEMISQNPENIRGWRLLEQISQSDAEKAEARLRILALDPKNPQN